MGEHTPESWGWEPPIAEGFHNYHRLTIADGTEVIATPDAEEDEGPWIAVRSAHARLIEAAPDLLAACKAHMEATSRPTLRGYAHVLKLTEAAIRKAEGKDSEGSVGPQGSGIPPGLGPGSRRFESARPDFFGISA